MEALLASYAISSDEENGTATQQRLISLENTQEIQNQNSGVGFKFEEKNPQKNLKVVLCRGI